MAGRAVASILSQIELPFCISSSSEDYVTNAIQLASDLERLSLMRETLRSQLVDSPICDTPSFAKSFEAAIFELWSHPGAI